MQRQKPKGSSRNPQKDMLRVIVAIRRQLRVLSMDSSGRPTLIDELDDVFKDLCGAKDFTRRVCAARTMSQFIGAVNQIGIYPLWDLLKDETLFDVMRSLVEINARRTRLKRKIGHLEKDMKAAERDAGSDYSRLVKKRKELYKEKSYISKLYKNSISALQDAIGIRDYSGDDYKARYSFLKSFSEKSFGDSFYYDDFGPDEFFDDEDIREFYGASRQGRGSSRGGSRRFSSPYEDLRNIATGGSRPRNTGFDISGSDIDDDDDYEGFDADEEQSDIDKLSDKMDTLISIMLGKASEEPSPRRVPTPKVAPVVTEADYSASTSNDTKIILSAIGKIGTRVDTLEQRHEELSDIVMQLVGSDSSFDEDDGGDDLMDVADASSMIDNFAQGATGAPAQVPTPAPVVQTQTWEPAPLIVPQEPIAPGKMSTEAIRMSASKDAAQVLPKIVPQDSEPKGPIRPREQVVTEQTDYEKAQMAQGTE